MTLSNTSQRVLFDGVLLCPPPQNPTGVGGGLINADGVNRTPEGGATQHVQRVPFRERDRATGPRGRVIKIKSNPRAKK